MRFVVHEFGEALHLLFEGDPSLWATVLRTVWLTIASTAVAGLIGVPLGAWIGMRSRGAAGGLRALGANVGLGLPPVVVGIVLGLLLAPGGLLGRLQWLVTLEGIWLAQVVLAAPLIAALTAAAAAQGPVAVVQQARALGADQRAQLALLLAELRPAILGALLAAALVGLGEVGAVIIIGGNVDGHTNTLASSVVLDLNASNPARAIADALVLGALIGALTWGAGRAQRAARAA